MPVEVVEQRTIGPTLGARAIAASTQAAVIGVSLTILFMVACCRLLDTLVNDACLQTVPRTLNTGMGAMFILVELLVLGGDTLADFALALLVGILIGTWSSVFVAAPLVVALERGHRSKGGRRR